MDYDKIEHDFVKRTLENLNACNNSNDIEHKVTNLLCQCLGLIVFPRSKDSTLGLEISSDDSSCKYGRLEKCDKVPDDKTTEDAFIRHLRNSLAHGRFIVENIDDKNNITELRFTDKKNDNETDTNFIFIITVEKLETLARDIAKNYLKNQEITNE